MIDYILVIWFIIFGITTLIMGALSVTSYLCLKKELYYLYEYDNKNEKEVCKYPLFKNKIVIDCDGRKKNIRVEKKKYLLDGNWYKVENPFFLDVCGKKRKYLISKKNIKIKNGNLKNIFYNNDFRKLTVSVALLMIFSISIINKYNSIRIHFVKQSAMPETYDKSTLDEGEKKLFSSFQISENDIYKRGIDVSEFQEEIDWKMVSGSGIDFVMVRLGYRGESTGDFAMDKCFEDNINGALTEGMPVGVYFVSHAVNEEEVKEEVEFFSAIISIYQVTYPVAVSWKPLNSGPSRADHVPGDEAIELLNYSCSLLSEKGYKPLVFIEDENYDLLDHSGLLDYDLWIDQHGKNLTIEREKCVMWQHGYTNISGIKGIVGADVYISPTFP